MQVINECNAFFMKDKYNKNIKKIFKNIGLIVSGIIIGMIVNMALIVLGGIIFILPENFEPMNAIN